MLCVCWDVVKMGRLCDLCKLGDISRYNTLGFQPRCTVQLISLLGLLLAYFSHMQEKGQQY